MPLWKESEPKGDDGVGWELHAPGRYRAGVAVTPVGTMVHLTILTTPATDEAAIDAGKLLAEGLVGRALAGVR